MKRSMIAGCAGAMIALAMALPSGAQQQAAAGKAQPTAEAKTAVVTESELAQWLVKTLGLTRSLPASPSAQECFAVLLQNGITPKDGWNATNFVSRPTLARVVVQSLRKQNEISDPANDAAWLAYVQSKQLKFDRVGKALDQLTPIAQPESADAAIVSTDPLKKVAHIRPLDESQYGTDLQASRRPVTWEEIRSWFAPTPRPPSPRPTTPS